MPAPLQIVLIALVATAAIYDFRFRRIPNWLSLSGLILGLGFNTLLFAQHGFVASGLGILLPLILYVPLYLLRAMGAGDVKLMAAVGCIAGPQNWIEILVCTAIAGGVVALAVAARTKRLQQTLVNVLALANELTHFRSPASTHETLNVRNSHSTRLPHAVTIAAGSLIFVLHEVVRH